MKLKTEGACKQQHNTIWTVTHKLEAGMWRAFNHSCQDENLV